MALLVRWLVLCTGKLCEGAPEVGSMALREQAHELLAKLLGADSPDVRAAAVFALGALVQAQEGGGGGGSPPPAPSAGTASTGALAPLSPASSAAGSSVGPGAGGVPGAPDAAAAAAAAAAPAEGPLPEAERLAVERAIACALLEVVYDASPVVRAEVATALARVAVGHSLLFQDAVHAHQRTSARILREQQQRAVAAAAAQGPQVVASAPAAAGVARSLPTAAPGVASGAGSIGRVASSGSLGGRSSSQQVASADPAAGQLQQQSPEGPSGAGTTAGGAAPLGSSPSPSLGASPGSGVRLREDSSYEPMLHVGLDHGSLGEQRGGVGGTAGVGVDRGAC